MPEEISEMPQFSDIIVDSEPPGFVQSIATQQQDTYTHESKRGFPMPERVDMENAILRVERRLAMQYPDRLAEVYAARDAYFGTLLVDEDVEKKDRRFKINSAEKQHAQVHALYQAGIGNDAAYSERMLHIAMVHEALSMQHIREERTTSFWNGVRSELGLSRMFIDQGFRVFLPQYLKKKREENEVARWDVDSGIDFCAIDKSGGTKTVLLVDVKGQYNFPREDMRGSITRQSNVRNTPDISIKPVDTILSLPKSLQYLITRFHPHDIYRARIVIPTHPAYLSNLKDAYTRSKGDPKETLAHFSLIDSRIQKKVFEGIYDQI